MFPDLTRDDVFRLETRRLWLRWPRAADAAAITAFAALPQVAQMTAAIPHPYPAQEADRFIFKARADNAAGQALHLAMTRKIGAADRFSASFPPSRTGNNEVEIGYALAPEMWGKGFASEAVRMLVNTIFALTPAVRIRRQFKGQQSGLARGCWRKSGFAYVDTGLDLLAGARRSPSLRPLPPQSRRIGAPAPG